MGKFIRGTVMYNADGTFWNPQVDGPIWFQYEELPPGLQADLLARGEDPENFQRKLKEGLESGEYYVTHEAYPLQPRGQGGN
jgi:hypothetical protein